VGDLCRQGMAVVMAEHKVDRIAARADKVLVLNRGRVLAWGPPGEVFSLDGLEEHGVAVPAVTRAARELGWREQGGTYPVTVEAAARIGGAALGRDQG